MPDLSHNTEIDSNHLGISVVLKINTKPFDTVLILFLFMLSVEGLIDFLLHVAMEENTDPVFGIGVLCSTLASWLRDSMHLRLPEYTTIPRPTTSLSTDFSLLQGIVFTLPIPSLSSGNLWQSVLGSQKGE